MANATQTLLGYSPGCSHASKIRHVPLRLLLPAAPRSLPLQRRERRAPGMGGFPLRHRMASPSPGGSGSGPCDVGPGGPASYGGCPTQKDHRPDQTCCPARQQLTSIAPSRHRKRVVVWHSQTSIVPSGHHNHSSPYRRAAWRWASATASASAGGSSTRTLAPHPITNARASSSPAVSNETVSEPSACSASVSWVRE